MDGDMAPTEQLEQARQKAALANRRRKQKRLAAELQEHGWTVLTPETALTRLAAQLDNLIEETDHICNHGLPKTRCGPCVAEHVLLQLEKIGAIPHICRNRK